jgi:hypothetical protein
VGSKTIQYNTAELKVEREAIANSRMGAVKKIMDSVRNHYHKITGLDENDPQELWQFAVGNSERQPNLTENKTSQMLTGLFRPVDLQCAESPEAYRRFRDSIGAPTLRETILALASRSKDDVELAAWLEKLLAIFKHGPISQAEHENICLSHTALFLLRYWIQEPSDNIQGSLAFFSDRAMAKLFYYQTQGKWLPLGRYEKEADRVRKVYLALTLRPADRRAIKDLDLRGGIIHFIPNKTLTPEGR